MSFSINTNFLGIWAGNKLRESQQALSTSIEKISTGRRINKASDDASGMVIADSLGAQARGMGQAIRNANDAISMAQIADGALDTSADIITTIRTKALQAANDSQSPQSRQAIQADIRNLLEQLDMTAKTTSYNGQKLLSGEFTDKSFQVGANANETVSLSIGSAETDQLGDNENGRLADVDVTTSEGAQTAIQIADAALSDVNNIRSEIGSKQNQLASTINNLTTAQINVLSAESTIRDVDLAEESMVMSRMKTLSKARSFAVAQANAKGANIMKLFDIA